MSLLGTAIGLLGMVLVGCGGGAGGEKSQVSAPSAEARKAFEEGKKYLLANDRAKAITAFTQAIQIAPKYQQAYVWRGVAYQEIGERQKALEDFTQAVQLDPTDEYAFAQRAQIYRKMGESAKAQADEDRAAQLREKNRSEIRKNVEQAKKRKKRP